MKIYSEIPKNLPPLALTIGTFDGVHLGHQALLKALKAKEAPAAVLTFSTHPLEVLRPPAPLWICSLDERLKFFEECGIDIAIAIPFSSALAATPYDAFLAQFPLRYLLLGEGDTLGKNRQGNREALTAYAEKNSFAFEYYPKLWLEGQIISSTRIRAAIASNDLSLASRLLGRTQPLEATHVY